MYAKTQRRRIFLIASLRHCVQFIDYVNERIMFYLRLGLVYIYDCYSWL